MGFLRRKKTQWHTAHPEDVACATPTSMGPISAGRGWVSSGRLANRFGSRFGTYTKLLGGVIGPISAPNDYQNTVFDDVLSMFGSCRNNALSRSPREKLQLFAILSLICYSQLGKHAPKPKLASLALHLLTFSAWPCRIHGIPTDPVP